MYKFIKIIYLTILIFPMLFFNLAIASEKLKIGLLVPITGSNKDLGESIIKAVRLALKDIDNDLIEVVPKDTASNPNKTLQSALEPRNDEILNYQINIDNYTRAIAKINDEHADNIALIEFRNNLSDMVESHKTEQLKAIIIRDVIADQITELEASSNTL